MMSRDQKAISRYTKWAVDRGTSGIVEPGMQTKLLYERGRPFYLSEREY